MRNTQSPALAMPMPAPALPAHTFAATRDARRAPALGAEYSRTDLRARLHDVRLYAALVTRGGAR